MGWKMENLFPAINPFCPLFESPLDILSGFFVFLDWL
jgi:hypothetical protein